jgi:outer membrane protein TolC
VKRAELELAAASLEVKKQQGAYFPVLYAEGGYVKQKRAFPVDEYGYGALRLSFDVFRGGEVPARVAFARERETQARLALDELRRQAREDVHVALLAVEAARARTKLADERLAAAQADYDQTFDQYRNQLLTTLDVQSAETSLADARRGRIAARLGHFLAEVRAYHAAGVLAPAARKEISR